MEKTKPLVSVIMPCYNHEKYVGEAIESVLNQTYDNIEFIVADNGSTDDSYAVIKKYENRITKIIQLKKNNRTLCGKRLRESANGEYIALMTSDDYWEKEKIELQRESAFYDQKYTTVPNRRGKKVRKSFCGLFRGHDEICRDGVRSQGWCIRTGKGYDRLGTGVL